MISHEHKFIFFECPKTGSTSVRRLFYTYYNAPLPGGNVKDYSQVFPYKGPAKLLPDDGSCLYRHMKPSICKKYFVKNNLNWSDYFKFSFVRNPWDRAVSMYSFKGARYIANPGHFKKVFPKNDMIDLQLLQNHSVQNFREYISRKPCRDGGQHAWADGVDFVGRVENLQQDVDTICDKIGIPPQQLPHKNKSKHKHYTEYYDDETREIVTKAYARDVEMFGYKFGE